MRRELTLGNLWTLALGAAAALASAGVTAADAPPSTATVSAATISPAEAQAIVEAAYVYGYPLMVMDATKRVVANGVTNRLTYLPRLPGPDDRSVVRPNVDALSTSSFLDVAAEPVVIHVPDTHGRYYFMEMRDAYTNVFASPGKRTTGTGAKDFAIVGPGFTGTIPPGLTRIDSPTPSGWVLSRTQVNGEEDTAAVVALQREYAIVPLSQWPAAGVEASPTEMPAEKASAETPPPMQVEQLLPTVYLARLATLLGENPPPVRDAQAVRRFAAIGLVPGRPFTPTPTAATVLERGRENALQRIKAKSASLGKTVNGWHIVSKNIGDYGTDYEQRAAVCHHGFGANLPADAVYPGTSVDDAGQKLTGAKRYVVHFDAENIPPVNAFWSLTMYDPEGWFVPNQAQRYAVRDTDLTRNPDGSIDIYVQADTPDFERASNWLPSPNGKPFSVLLRMYWPQASVLDGSYAPTGIRIRRN